VYFLVYEYLVVIVYAMLELEEAEEDQQQRPQKIHLNWLLIQMMENGGLSVAENNSQETATDRHVLV
jgi:hypothetical protein